MSRRTVLSAGAVVAAAGFASRAGATVEPQATRLAGAGRVAQERGDFGAVSSLDMRLANLGLRNGYSLGIETAAGMLDVASTAAALGLHVPHDMDDLLQHGRGGELLAFRAALADRPDAAVLVEQAELSFAPLVTRPEKIICVGFNYRRHAEETGTPIPKAPPLFNKFSNVLNRHGGEIKLPTTVDDRFDYETELVIVFGRECRAVREAEALDYVAGYATGNDFSARSLQMATTQFMAGKSADVFGPVGPWLVTRDRVPDPNALKLRTLVNGKVRQDWTTADMIFSCRKLISYASSVMTIKPGDIMFTGTPQGVILGEKAPPEQRRWLRAGDVVVSSIEGLGDLEVTLA